MVRDDGQPPPARGSGPPARGRPRDGRVDEAIAAATRELLVEVGYPGTSLELVARRAGVARTSIYRRWPSKAHLVYETVFTDVGPRTIPDTGDVAADLRTLVRAMIAEFGTPAAVAAAAGVLADFGADEGFRTLVREQFLAPVKQAVELVLRTAVARGELGDAVAVDTISGALGGAVFFRCVVLGEPADPDTAEDLVRLVLDGARSPRPRPPRE
ncbi:TetR/AcrR family transcriptional regulator [Longispora urticae]